MLNIVIPMAGKGSRFANEGFVLPKPLIPVHDIPMIRLVIENLRPEEDHRFIFLALQEHIEKFNLPSLFQAWTQNKSIVVPVNKTTEGAACTVLLAKEYINNENPIMIANSDQWVDFNINAYLDVINKNHFDGLIMTMSANDPKWSFVKLNGNLVQHVAEKQVISNEATVGIYNFSKGKDFVSASEEMITKNLRVNNEFYVAPVYNELIAKGAKVSFYNVGKEDLGMYGLGIPSDLKKFLDKEISQKAIKGISL